MVQKYINAARVANLKWPSRETKFEDFARGVYDLMVTCHSEDVNGSGLHGGKQAARRSNRKQSPEQTCRRGDAASEGSQPEDPTYTLQHITRHFIIAADRLVNFNYEGMKYADIEPYMPDVKGAAACMRHESLLRIKDEFGLDPLYLSCLLCFAGQLRDDELEAVIRTKYVHLYKPIGDRNLMTKGTDAQDYSCPPPNFASFLRAIATDPGDTECKDAAENQAPKKQRQG